MSDRGGKRSFNVQVNVIVRVYEDVEAEDEDEAARVAHRIVKERLHSDVASGKVVLPESHAEPGSVEVGVDEVYEYEPKGVDDWDVSEHTTRHDTFDGPVGLETLKVGK